MLRWFFFLIAVWVVVEYYSWQTFRLATDHKWVRRLYLILSIFVVVFFMFNIFRFDRRVGINRTFMFSFGLLILFLAPKLIVALLALLSDALRLGEGIVRRISDKTTTPFMPDRRRVTAQIILALAAIPFTTILYGIFRGKYHYRVLKKTIYFDKLPEAFDGFKILQLSDIHCGSFDSKTQVRAGVDLVNEQDFDLMVFTGDMVNSRATEMDDWYSVFSKLKTPSAGKYAILGNHDYGGYVQWPTPQDKVKNFEDVKGIFPKLGFKLLLNENVQIEREGSAISLVGVENWGKKFQQYGDLEKASEGVPPEAFKILLTHDPTHWDEKVRNNTVDYALTLAGHTHGMQVGVDIPGVIKWSPSRFVYPHWAGLYEEAGRYLYVNRGFGFLGFPGRVGMWPEITVLELRKSRV